MMNNITPEARLRPRDVARFRFDERLEGHPIPIWPFDPSGRRRDADGSRVFDADQAASSLCPVESLSRVWESAMRECGLDVDALLELDALPAVEPGKRPPTPAELLERIVELVDELRAALASPEGRR